MFKRNVWGYDPRQVAAAVFMLEAKIEELNLLIGELEVAHADLQRERPVHLIAQARWDAEKIRLEAKADAADMLRMAAFRRDLIVATADRSEPFPVLDLTLDQGAIHDTTPPDVRAAG